MPSAFAAATTSSIDCARLSPVDAPSATADIDTVRNQVAFMSFSPQLKI
jgi:hypothetical protein